MLCATGHALPTLNSFCVIIVILYNLNNEYVAGAQSILDRFRPNSNISSTADEPVKVVPGIKMKRFERFTVPLDGSANILQARPPHYYIPPQWQAGAKIIGEGIDGIITFQQLPYNNGVKVTLNGTGIPAGRHALHIHTYGELTDGCKSTGMQFPNNFLGNIDVKDGGEVNVVFLSIYLTLFGYNGIIGRSIVIHEKPIDLNTALNADIFSSSLYALHDSHSYHNEENSVGESIACGIISIMNATATEK